ncbi:MAG: carboxylesterase family protein [Polyangiaceae bacterium]|nr:carboxylesterase family protein [Polyangiaceae bacterium]
MRHFLGALLGGVVALTLGACDSGNDTTGTGGTGASGGSGGAGAGGSAACPTTVKAEPGTVITERGAVVGAKAGTTWAFQGIPYAAPPVGDLRWKAPEPHACWEDAKPTQAFGAACKQLNGDGAPVGAEDCLTLNVWAPETASAASPVPVLFFIHGGGNTQGSSSAEAAGVPIYDGQTLSERGGVIVVTINYRLGPFGWLAHSTFAPEGEADETGNYGLKDQVFALEWVKANIGAFGGDPSRVMVFGESAGALNTCLVLTSPKAAGLFSGALMESGGCVAQTKEVASAEADNWATLAGCQDDADPAACMRALNENDAVSLLPAPIDLAGKQGPFQPHVDGAFIPKAPFDLLASGDFNHVPFVVGANENETGQAVPDMTEAEYEALVNATFAALAPQVLAQYPAADYPTPRDAYVAVTSDAKFICGARRIARAAAGSTTVFRYHFTHVLDNVGPQGKKNGAFHGLELLFLFDKLTIANYMASDGEKALAEAMGGYWSRFGATGDPNGNGAVEWPVYDPVTDSYLQLDTTIVADAGVHTVNCDFWDSLL